MKLLQSLEHEHIVAYLDSFITEKDLYIAIEFADKGDLRKLIKKMIAEKEKFDEQMVIRFTHQLATALQHMHSKRIIHRDLKPANILVFSDNVLKLGDLGLSRHMSEETYKAFSKVGTPLYMSPELIEDSGYDFKADVWSLGCVIYELMTLRSPFQTEEKVTFKDIFKKINTADYEKISDKLYSEELSELVDKMLQLIPEERSSLEEVVEVCEKMLANYETNKPFFNPFVVMEDIVDKLKLINYKRNYCRKYKKQPINKFFFAKLSVSLKDMNERDEFKLRVFVQHAYWLISIICNDVPISKLEYDKTNLIEAAENLESLVKEIINIVVRMNVPMIKSVHR